MSGFTGTFNNESKLSELIQFEKENISKIECLHFSKVLATANIDNNNLFLFGELYNFDSKKEAWAETILKNYLDSGVDTFKALDGEFTFIITNEMETLIYRDRHGAGPQVYYNDFYYASFLKNFLDIKNFKPEPNIEALYTFLSIGYIPSPSSSLLGVSKIPGGCFLKVNHKKQELVSLYPWSDYKSACLNPVSLSVDEATAQYEELHKQAIKQRVAGKNKVGLLLSGGYDSGGNIAGLREVYGGDTYSYSIGFKDNPWTELPLAKILSEHFDTKHHEYEIDGTEIKELPNIVEYLGDPFQEGGLMVNYTAMKLIGDNKPDVILGGDGNDQHFGTAGKELAMNYSFRKKGYAPFQKMFAGLGSMGLFNKDNIFFRAQFHNDKILNIQKSDNFGFKKHQLKKLSAKRTQFGSHQYLKDLPSDFKTFDDFYFMHNYFGDIKQVINEVILFKASKMSSMFGNVLSFPYMNTDIYNFLKTLPRELKFKGTLEEISKGKGLAKFLHKNYLQAKLPNEITNRKKQGGFAPLPIFFEEKNQREKLAQFVLNSDASKELFNIEYLKHFFNDYNATVATKGYWFWYKQVKAFQFFNLLVISLWWEIFINKKSKEELNGYID